VYAAYHFLGSSLTPEQDETVDDLSNRSLSLMTVRDARVCNSSTRKDQEIVIEAYNDPIVRVGICQLFFVGGVQKPGILCGRDIDITQSQPVGNGVWDTLVKMILDFHRHP